MSSFIVTNETIVDCVDAILGRNASEEKRVFLGQRLVEMNTYAVNVRYRETSPADTYVDDKSQMPQTNIQLFKSMQCFIYQCSEGDTETAFPEYAMVEEVMNRMAREIVVRLPQYETAAWDRS